MKPCCYFCVEWQCQNSNGHIETTVCENGSILFCISGILDTHIKFVQWPVKFKKTFGRRRESLVNSIQIMKETPNCKKIYATTMINISCRIIKNYIFYIFDDITYHIIFWSNLLQLKVYFFKFLLGEVEGNYISKDY